MHWGGGTPTFLSAAQMRELMQVTGEHFQLLGDDSGEYSIEIDPREADAEIIATLRAIGFNRLSLGIQDFDAKVQLAVNRIQSEQQTAAVIDAAREQGFKSISVDLIYGLPLQSVDSFTQTLERVIALNSDRIPVFNYAHLPALFKVQRQIKTDELPNSEVKLAILQRVIQRLCAAGYVYIGMDHFAKPEDELARAQQHGTLHRNFQGYSTHADCDLVAMGMTAIGKVGNSYSQNAKSLDDYCAAIDKGQVPIIRGIALSDDDQLRRAVITQLICQFSLNYDFVEKRYRINFVDYFAEELKQLEDFELDGLLYLHPDGIDVLPAGRLLIRNICMVFDRYLRQRAMQGFSKAI